MRAHKLPTECLAKARAADRRQGVQPGEAGWMEAGWMEAKLVGMGTVRGILSGNFGEMSEDTHFLVAAMSNSRVRVTGPSRGRRGRMRGEEAECSIAVSSIRRRLGVMAVRCQASSLLGRLENFRPGWCCCCWPAVAGHRDTETVAAGGSGQRPCQEEGYRALRTGFAKGD